MSSFLWFQYQCCPDNLKYNLSCWGPWGQGGKGWHQFSAKREILQNNCLDKIVVCSYGSLRTFCNFWTFLDFSNSLELFWPNGTSRSPYLKAAILDPRQSNADGSPYLLVVLVEKVSTSAALAVSHWNVVGFPNPLFIKVGMRKLFRCHVGNMESF